jgi:acylphosphatase
MPRPTYLGGCFLAAALVIPGPVAAAGVKIDVGTRTVRIPAVVAEQGKYDVLKGAIEYVLVSKGGKEYETLFVTECAPEEVHRALGEAAFEPGRPGEDDKAPKGARAGILVEYEEGGKTVRRPVDEFILLARTGARLRPRSWVFTGSTRAFDPQAKKEVLQSTVTKSIIGLHYADPSSLLQSSRSEAREENIYRADGKSLPSPGKPVTLILCPFTRDLPSDRRRVHVLISGRVQGVGFRAYAEGQAKRLGLEGFVKDLPDGHMEAVVEGPRDSVAAVLRKLEKGPRAARVKSLDAKEETPTGEFEEFRVEY